MKTISNSDLSLIVKLFDIMSDALRSDGNLKVINARRRAKLLSKRLNKKINEKKESKDPNP